ncbi:flagellar hook-basal body protein FliE [Meridianimarinicoccus roseus]|uniref:Flagellar hook-basal body protein FliE n=1 Tax=Meridianimarinicoccus roseus TaxID=2072018 RepID=A0A2V2LFH1_9RHOB|nr:flagellar hook-basal body complex protein FliE [Meridianimarinicoccus roseus]PWR04370.1 flagellar hook-basal body protein FliE [Meridianimarinicoccus roseus]
MDFSSARALQSYISAKPATHPTPREDAGAGAAGAMLADFASTLQATDTVAQDTLATGADPHALVEALAQTQLAVETAVTVRDRVVEAYQEILRMPV